MYQQFPASELQLANKVCWECLTHVCCLPIYTMRNKTKFYNFFIRTKSAALRVFLENNFTNILTQSYSGWKSDSFKLCSTVPGYTLLLKFQKMIMEFSFRGKVVLLHANLKRRRRRKKEKEKESETVPLRMTVHHSTCSGWTWCLAENVL